MITVNKVVAKASITVAQATAIMFLALYGRKAVDVLLERGDLPAALLADDANNCRLFFENRRQVWVALQTREDVDTLFRVDISDTEATIVEEKNPTGTPLARWELWRSL